MFANLPLASRLSLACRLNTSICFANRQTYRVWAAPTKTPFLFANFFFAAPSCKEKVAMDVEKPRGYSRLASASSLPAFSFDERCAKEKAIKKKTLIYGALPQTPRAFEKARQNFTKKVCANKAINQNLPFGGGSKYATVSAFTAR